MIKAKQKKLNCYKCKYFQIRHTDKYFRYGCKALGFKSHTKNWYWLITPCPYFELHPNRQKKKSNNKNLDSDNHKVNIFI
jgi:hypothetical protein